MADVMPLPEVIVQIEGPHVVQVGGVVFAAEDVEVALGDGGRVEVSRTWGGALFSLGSDFGSLEFSPGHFVNRFTCGLVEAAK